ncbi:MAG: 2-oxoglutarate dehydrogenase E1 component [Polyangiales bacterium]
MSDFGVNQGLVEEMFLAWMSNPSAVEPAWRKYFDNLPQGEWPQLTSSGSLTAPAEHVPSAPLPRETHASNGVANASPAPLAGLPGASPSVFFPPGAENLPFVAERVAGRPSFPPTGEMLAATQLQARLSALINAYRVRGHLYAKLDPLGLKDLPPTELALERYGLANVDPSTVFSTDDFSGPPSLPLGEIVERLRETYTRTIGVEYTFLEDKEAREWLQDEMESSTNHTQLDVHDQLRILTKLTDAEIFEQFLHTKYIGAKRFSLEGGESVVPLLDLLIERASEHGVDEIVIGMAHRGRLNVMVNILEMDVRDIFAGFEDKDPRSNMGRGDVKYHMGFSTDRKTEAGREIHMTLAFNPSHLEWVNPVVEGRVRAKQDRKGDKARSRVLPLLIHGDSAFIGQGVVAETLNLSEIGGYRTGGTVHVIINNQIGFTTNPEDARSTRYCTDITRMLRCPVFHVNGEDPEAVAQVAHLAAEYRQRFGRDVVVDLYCYRKYGHNEGDEPRFTQPLMYAAVDQKRTVRQVYIERLVETGKITRQQAEDIENRRRAFLDQALEEARRGKFALKPSAMLGVWESYTGGRDVDTPRVDTGYPREKLVALIDKLTTIPDGFTPHPRLKRFVLDKQREIMTTGVEVDWGTAENLALSSMLVEGIPCRLTGQDVRRGTFSHRHAVIFDSVTGARYTRLGHLSDNQARLEIVDSPLSEAGVVGFEWGYSLDTPDALILWEAQFGDFMNTAQVIIDQFISSSEDKWHRLSGLVLALPHGFEGQGPEHSSARLERFLMLCAEDNMQVVNLTTPAQVFHVLRRQVLRPWRKPLVIMTPKSLLRHKRAVSTLDELATGRFERLLPDAASDSKGAPKDASKVTRVVLCSGKVYFDLEEEREKLGADHVALLRLEQLYPLHPEEIRDALAPYADGTDLVWCQEEPWNMGAWYFIRARLPEIVEHRLPLRCVARPESASPATGSSGAHKLEQRMLIDEVFAS